MNDDRKDDYFELIQSQERLEFALQSGHMGTWDFDLDNENIFCSREMLELWGVDPQSFKNDRSVLQSKVHPEDLLEMNAAIDKAIRNRTIYEFEYRIHPSPGIERWVLSRGRCTFAPNSEHSRRFAGIVYDITERRIREKELAEAFKIRDECFTIASHEIKTPLTAMQLLLEVMQWEIKKAGTENFSAAILDENLNKQKIHLSRVARIVNNILDDSRTSEGRLSLKTEIFDLKDMVYDVIDQLKRISFQAGVEIKFSPTESIIGKWDRFRLEQVVQNLLMNSIRYGNSKPVEVKIKKENDAALIIVCDKGCGIAIEDQTRIFQRFERANTENKINGMGLGLFISKNIVLAHGGEIFLRSEIGRGSEFTVRIPCNLQ